ncbi:LOW QUALITY PROTEIN: putative clathrin assembly protein At1g03050 [Dioscorea cayenensis subsp. rotundata]|uniref:LOW QUALITY PROTEIN: putative clathrin assembly protein At1g03050 n=1 Tax=Dioscorea cayennensis subsp. rotundata TaxID=55577 RepID=A0AB40CFZ5_DIOCR|nr:LOW QUALITY PROTEIN: putative clathrin assembly protein At1g03050 [Dioscorea cayenensis subsp. rotundata]
MAQNTIRRALGAVKDQTSISLAKVGNSASLSDLDVAIVKATRHDDYPAEERYIREILSLTSYSRAFISSCVSTLSRRLSKTRSWTVALKTLILIHRVLVEGDPAYEQEIFFSTRRGTRMFNLSDFRDQSRADGWDFSTFVRAYARYLDERLEYRMHGRRQQRRSRAASLSEDEDAVAVMTTVATRATPVREMKTDRIFVKMQHLLQLLERFLACRPTGAARNNRIVAMALQPLIRESHQTYYEIHEIMNIFIDRFMEMEIADCVCVHAIFTRLSKQLQDLSSFYNWCKSSSVSRTYDFPFIHSIPSDKLELMDELIRHRTNLTTHQNVQDPDLQLEINYDINHNVPTLPPPPDTDTQSNDEQHEKDDELALALALFNGSMEWQEFKGEDEGDDWETALVQSAGVLSSRMPKLGGNLDMLLLDGLYQQSDQQMMMNRLVVDGSASSVALPVAAPAILALPALPGAVGGDGDPFVASQAVPPPSYVQMSEMERKQMFMLEEQRAWEQYARDGMQGKLGFVKLQSNYSTPSQQQYRGGGGF